MLMRWAVVVGLLCAGCGGIPTRQIIADVVPLGKALTTACPEPPSDPVEDRIAAVKARLHEHPVVNFVVDAIRIGVTPQESRAQKFRDLHDLNATTLKNFGDRIHERFFRHDPDRNTIKVDLARVEEFNQVLVAYVSAYVDGKYIDRFGNNLPAPAISRTVGNTEIAGVLSVIIDAVGDYVVRGPIWTDGTGKIYYPAAFNEAAPDLEKDPKKTPLRPTVVDVTLKSRGQDGDGTPLIKPCRSSPAAAASTRPRRKRSSTSGRPPRSRRRWSGASPGGASAASAPRSARSARSRWAITRPCRS
jgi:hypothetical protein